LAGQYQKGNLSIAGDTICNVFRCRKQISLKFPVFPVIAQADYLMFLKKRSVMLRDGILQKSTVLQNQNVLDIDITTLM
jgi:hypothetical protein